MPGRGYFLCTWRERAREVQNSTSVRLTCKGEKKSSHYPCCQTAAKFRTYFTVQSNFLQSEDETNMRLCTGVLPSIPLCVL